MDHIVVATSTEDGTYHEFFSGRKCAGVKQVTPSEVNWDQAHAARKVEIWSCEEKDIPVVVDEMTKYFPGTEVKVFKLTQIYSRLPGELKHLTVTKDGALPI